jgi:hypothetical protein
MSQLMLTLQICEQWAYMPESARLSIKGMIAGEPFEGMPISDLRPAFQWLHWTADHYHGDRDFDELVARLGHYLEGVYNFWEGAA